ncbi:MAG TPA: thioesterase family protein, partial [Pirellulales bacterium]|nr:thioesterase family protein [Pirellulales bacterium]
MSAPSPEPLAGFPVVLSLSVLWGDQDAFQHVNNTVYLRWCESARIAYIERIGLNDLMVREQIGPILASITCNYRRPLTYPDTVRIGARITRLGRSSLTMEHRVVSETAGDVAADAESTLVVFDYARKTSHPIPEGIRAAI